MFSGIVQSVQSVQTLERLEEGARFTVPWPDSFSKLRPGASVAVDGVCLTLENNPSEFMQFFVGAETNRLLAWSDRYKIGNQVNLEASLCLGDPVDGHFMTGHVDSLGVVEERKQVGDSLLLVIRIGEGLEELVWHKGSLAVNGVSLTINEISNGRASFCLIPETQKRTNLGSLAEGDQVHIEPDVLARIVQRQLKGQIQEKVGS